MLSISSKGFVQAQKNKIDIKDNAVLEVVNIICVCVAQPFRCVAQLMGEAFAYLMHRQSSVQYILAVMCSELPSFAGCSQPCRHQTT
jgi:hypothetical protein